MSRMMSDRHRSGWRMMVVTAVVFPVVLVAQILAGNEWDPSVFAAFGEADRANLEVARGLLGREVVVRPRLGHDGRFFFIQANDPLITSPETYFTGVDRPAYRARRVTYPALAGGLGLLNAEATLWGMALVNMVTLAAGTILTARLAVRHGLSPWLGLAFLGNPGIFSELIIGGAGIVALALLVGAVCLLDDDRPWLAGAALALAILSREVMALAVLGAVVWEWRRGSPRRIPALSAPVLVGAAWWAYVWWRLPGPLGDQRELTLVPFQGIASVIAEGWDTSVDLVLGFGGLVAATYLAARVFLTSMRLSWLCVPFVVLLPFLTPEVLGDYFNYTRALSPVLLAAAFVLAWDVGKRSSRVEVNRHPPPR